MLSLQYLNFSVYYNPPCKRKRNCETPVRLPQNLPNHVTFHNHYSSRFVFINSILKKTPTHLNNSQSTSTHYLDSNTHQTMKEGSPDSHPPNPRVENTTFKAQSIPTIKLVSPPSLWLDYPRTSSFQGPRTLEGWKSRKITQKPLILKINMRDQDQMANQVELIIQI